MNYWSYPFHCFFEFQRFLYFLYFGPLLTGCRISGAFIVALLPLFIPSMLWSGELEKTRAVRHHERWACPSVYSSASVDRFLDDKVEHYIGKDVSSSALIHSLPHI